jgi:hypothetical protein
MTSVRATDPGYGGGGRVYKRDPKGSETGGQFTANPAPVISRPPSPAYQAALNSIGKGGGGSAPKNAGQPASSKFKTLAPGEANDPATVREMQQLLTALGFGPLNVTGEYDRATQNAVMAVQRRLGMKRPNGKASRALVNKLLAAYDLSPCIQRG